ncbi:hypothetical protein ACU4GA_19900 [Methylobacterium oryzae CBMB20]
MVYVLIIMLAGSGLRDRIRRVQHQAGLRGRREEQIAEAERPYGGAYPVTVCAAKG